MATHLVGDRDGIQPSQSEESSTILTTLLNGLSGIVAMIRHIIESTVCEP